LPAALKKLLKQRVSCRRFSSEPLALAHLGALLHAGYGVIGRAVVNGRKFDHRPVPSAGALYPMHIFVLVRAVAGADMGTYRYDPAARRLTPVGARPADATIAAIFLDQPYVSTASAIIVAAAELGRPLERYADRGYRYVLFEAGHVAQNIAVCAAATGVGNLQIGGFLDDHLTTVLRIDGRTTVPLYAAAVGYPGSEDPAVVRCTE
jgi:SagB-type dehydrogenase family enzyme